MTPGDFCHLSTLGEIRTNNGKRVDFQPLVGDFRGFWPFSTQKVLTNPFYRYNFTHKMSIMFS